VPSRSVLVGLLADRIDRLQATFAALNSAVRDKVAEIVGKTVSDVVRQTVRMALEPRAEATVYRPEPDDELCGDEPDARRRRPGGDEEDEWVRPTAVPKTPDRPLPRLATAVVIGGKVASWWLTRLPSRKGWTWFAAGVVAAVGAYTLGPVAVAILPALAALALAARSVEFANNIPL
jgi:hypothetical protein